MDSQNQKESFNNSLQFLQQKIQQLENQPLIEEEKVNAHFEQAAPLGKLVDFLELYISFQNFQKFKPKLLSKIVNFIEKMELENCNATGLKLLKKKVDFIKHQIEEGLKDQEVKQIFLDPSKLD